MTHTENNYPYQYSRACLPEDRLCCIKKMEHYTTLAQLHNAYGFPPPENPLFSILSNVERAENFGNYIAEHTSDCYMICLKQFSTWSINYGYGKTKYDHTNGTMLFINPRQIISINDIEQKVNGYMLLIHEDFLAGHPLHDEIKQYGFFDYQVNEALNLSPGEEKIVEDLFQKIAMEYGNNQDEFSKEIMLSHVQSLLKYGSRFYKRQFTNRKVISGYTINRFNEILAGHLKQDVMKMQGLPTVKYVASKLNISSRYLSDLLKQETGKTAIELIHLALISEAKNRLKSNNNPISEIGHALGFENLPYFSKLFKKEVGIGPKEYRDTFLN